MCTWGEKHTARLRVGSLVLRLIARRAATQRHSCLSWCSFHVAPFSASYYDPPPLPLPPPPRSPTALSPTALRVLMQVNEKGPGQKLAALCDVVVQAFDQAGLILPVGVGF